MQFRIAVIAVLAMALSIFAGGTASAQQTVNIAPDDRFAGYPRSLIEWPSSLPDLNACVAGEFYEPVDTHLVKYVSRVQVARERAQEHDECVWMLTRSKWRWVLRPEGTKVATDAQGRDLFDFGSSSGKKCANPRPISVPIAPPLLVAPPPPPPPVEAPKPVLAAPTCTITGDRRSGFTGIAVHGEGRWWFDGIEQEAGDRFVPPSILKPGIHLAEFKVSGPGGQFTCPRKIDEFTPLISTAPSPTTKEPPPTEIKKRCKWPWLIAGGAATALIIYATRGEEKKPPPPENKPPRGVFSPTRQVGLVLRF